MRDEVPDCRLSTLADRMRLPHKPTHRAFADALATTDLLHALLERAGTLGVLGLDDLIELPTIRAHPQANKLKLTTRLPRRPGVYLFRGQGGKVLYVGKASNLRVPRPLLLRRRRAPEGPPAAAGDRDASTTSSAPAHSRRRCWRSG